MARVRDCGTLSSCIEEFRKITEDPLTLMLSNEITTESGDKFKIRQTTNAPGDAKEVC